MLLSLIFAFLALDIPAPGLGSKKPLPKQEQPREPKRPPQSIQDAFPRPRVRPVLGPPGDERIPIGREGVPGEAVVLGVELPITENAERIKAILELLEKTKGYEYTAALAEATARLGNRPQIQQQARAALARRMNLFNSRTLLLYISHKGIEYRLAATVAAGEKRYLTLVPRLIENMQDEKADIGKAAYQALKKITGQDLGDDAQDWWRWWVRLFR